MTVATRQIPDIVLSQEPVFERRAGDVEVRFYGRLYNQQVLHETDFSRADKAILSDLLNRLAGHFLVICQDRRRDVSYVANDIFGNFRLYYRPVGEGLRFSDDWRLLAEEMRHEEGYLRPNELERYYQERHSYTTGGHTLITGLEKLMPGALVTLSEEGWSEDIYFRAGVNHSNDDEHYRRRNLQLLTENIRQGIEPGRKTIVLFSGGIDSTLLCLILRRERIPFTAVLIQYDPPDRDNIIDQRKARTVADNLGLDMRVISVSIREKLDTLKAAFRRHPFDRAFAVPYYGTLELLREEYGRCNLINGQSSDSIYCFGPSSKTIGGMIQRYILSRFYARGHPSVNRAIAVVAERLYRRRWRIDSNFRVPTGIPAYGQGLLDPEGYLPIIHTGQEWHSYRQYLQKIVSRIARQLDFDDDAFRMYMKMMYLQGTSNVFPIESAGEYGHNPVLPFVDARLVHLRMQYQKEWKNLFRPKYVLEETLHREFSFNPAVIEHCRTAPIQTGEVNRFNDVEKEVRREWDRLSEGLW